MLYGKSPGTILRVARNNVGLTLAQAAEIAGLRGRSSWGQRETSCSPRAASRLLTALHDTAWVCIEGPGWAVAGPADDVRAKLVVDCACATGPQSGTRALPQPSLG